MESIGVERSYVNLIMLYILCTTLVHNFYLINCKVSSYLQDKNSMEPDQLASDVPSDLDLNYF